MDIIFAQASARGKAGVSIVRVSGDGLREGLAELVTSWPEPRQAGLRTLRIGDEVLDHALVIWFPAGSSFTGEEVVEFHLHGSMAIIAGLLDHLGSLEGFRLAEPGEFTRRALLNGRLDLTRVEGLADLIDAETEAQRRQAMRVFSGALAEKCEIWRGHLLKASAYLAATIDFAEEDLPDVLVSAADEHVRLVLEDLKREMEGFRTSERIRDGFEVAILGRPNVGKSTLLNRIAGREAALTSSIAGTTRDIIEVRMDLGGLPVTFLDTAGLRDSQDPIELMGINRAMKRAVDANIRVFLIENRGEEFALEPLAGDIVLISKDDGAERVDGVSGKTGAGVANFLNQIEERLKHRSASASLITRQRHQKAVRNAIHALERFHEAHKSLVVGEELLSEYLREALDELGYLMGKFDIEEVLGELFSSFCIGK